MFKMMKVLAPALLEYVVSEHLVLAMLTVAVTVAVTGCIRVCIRVLPQVLVFMACWLVVLTGRDVRDLTEVLRILFGRGRDPDRDHPRDQSPDP